VRQWVKQPNGRIDFRCESRGGGNEDIEFECGLPEGHDEPHNVLGHGAYDWQDGEPPTQDIRR